MNAATVQDEIPCAQCGYLLRGLNPDGRCPECNFPVGDSLQAHKAGPTRRAIRMLLIGVVTLIAVLLLWPYAEDFAFSSYAPRHLRGVYLNPDGTRYLLLGVLLLMPGWLLDRSDPRRRSRVGRMVLALPVALIVLAALMFYLLVSSSRPGNVILLSAYALAPFVCTAQVILLLELVARYTQHISAGPRRLWIRLAQWILGGVLLIGNLAWVPVGVARIVQDLGFMKQPKNQSYLPDGWNRILRPMYAITGYATQPAFYVAVLVLVCYAIVLFRRTRRALPG